MPTHAVTLAAETGIEHRHRVVRQAKTRLSGESLWLVSRRLHWSHQLALLHKERIPCMNG